MVHSLLCDVSESNAFQPERNGLGSQPDVLEKLAAMAKMTHRRL